MTVEAGTIPAQYSLLLSVPFLCVHKTVVYIYSQYCFHTGEGKSDSFRLCILFPPVSPFYCMRLLSTATLLLGWQASSFLPTRWS